MINFLLNLFLGILFVVAFLLGLIVIIMQVAYIMKKLDEMGRVEKEIVLSEKELDQIAEHIIKKEKFNQRARHIDERG